MFDMRERRSPAAAYGRTRAGSARKGWARCIGQRERRGSARSQPVMALAISPHAASARSSHAMKHAGVLARAASHLALVQHPDAVRHVARDADVDAGRALRARGRSPSALVTLKQQIDAAICLHPAQSVDDHSATAAITGCPPCSLTLSATLSAMNRVTATHCSALLHAVAAPCSMRAERAP